MADHTTPNKTKAPIRVLARRRVVLLASSAGIAASLLFAGSGVPFNVHLPSLGTPAHAEVAMRPASFADIVEKVKPAVFAVRVKLEDDAQSAAMSDDAMPQFPPGSPFERFFKRFGFGEGPEGMRPRGPRGGRHFSMAQGSGFFISADGYAVTNNHVVNHGQTVEVKIDDGKTYPAKVIGTDSRTDIALLKVDGRSDFPFVKFSEKLPRIGDWVLAVGNPFGLGGTVTAGIVSASGRDIGAGPYDDFIQIDAPVNKGNSGGPTFDLDGNVIGVNTAIYSPSGGNVGIAFAIPAENAKLVVNQLKEKGTVTRGWIGVQIQPVTSEVAESLGLKNDRGALVADAQGNGPAAKAGVQPGDVIVAVNGTPVKDARDLAKKVGGQTPGETVELGIIRKGNEQTIQVKLGTLPEERQAQAESGKSREEQGTGVPNLGLTLAPASSVAGAGGEGAVVTNVDPDGPAAERGFKTGDVILEVAGKPVSSPGDVRKALGDARSDGKKNVLVRVKSANGTRFVALPIGQA